MIYVCVCVCLVESIRPLRKLFIVLFVVRFSNRKYDIYSIQSIMDCCVVYLWSFEMKYIFISIHRKRCTKKPIALMNWPSNRKGSKMQTENRPSIKTDVRIVVGACVCVCVCMYLQFGQLKWPLNRLRMSESQ